MSALIIVVCVAVIAVLVALRFAADRSISLEKLRQQYCQPQSRFVVLAGHQVHVVDEGDGPVLVLLHGNGTSLWLWNHWAQFFVAAGYRVIRIDLPPYGLSSYSTEKAYGIVTTHAVLADLLDEKSIRRAVLIGIANGAPPAAWYSVTHPDRVAGLVLINAPFYPPENYTDTLKTQRWARKHLYPRIGRPWIADWLYVRELAGRNQPLQRRFVSHIHDLARRQDIREPLTVYGSSFDFPSKQWNPQGISNKQMLAGVRTPALILWGGRSLLPDVEAKRLADHLSAAPDPLVKVIKDAGHWLPLYRPRETAEPVMEFLSTISDFQSPSDGRKE